MLDDISHLILVDGIPDVVEIAFVALSSFRPFIREIDLHLGHSHDFIEEIFDTNLIVGWRIAEFDLLHLEEFLLAGKDFFHIILGHHIIW